MKLRTKILVTILLGIIAYLFIQQFGARDRHTAEVYKLTAGEMAQDYRDYNEKYFYGGLPPVLMIVTDDLPENVMAQTLCLPTTGDVVDQLAHQSASKCIIIRISPHYHPSPKEADMTLLHEMCHVWDAKNRVDEGSDDHGPSFQGCMLRLAEKGAFNGLW